jgi:hypothetical protein
MKLIVAAVLATIRAACAEAQPAAQLPKDFTEFAFNAGQNFGLAEGLAGGCPLAAVDPKMRQGFLATFPRNYMDVFEKGFADGWHKAFEEARDTKIEATLDEKRCLLGLGLYGPKGTVIPNLIIMLGRDRQH